MNYFWHQCSSLVNALLPQQCALCAGPTDSRSAVCPACENRLPVLPARCCPGCADFSPAGTLCGHCLTAPPAFDAVISPFLYGDPIDRLIQALKYGHQLRLADWFGQALARQLCAAPERMPAVDMVIALPLHPDRMKTRGFNQALEIARPIARRLGCPLRSDVVRRVRNTLPQADLSRDDRQRNIRNAFECALDLTEKAVLVVDDVLTTGSSASELARVLKLHGAGRVIVATAARTHHH